MMLIHNRDSAHDLSVKLPWLINTVMVCMQSQNMKCATCSSICLVFINRNSLILMLDVLRINLKALTILTISCYIASELGSAATSHIS